MKNCTAAASASVLVLVTDSGAFNANADEAAAKSILKATRIAALAVALIAMPALGAAFEHASQKELDQCKLEASRATVNPQAANSGRHGGKPKAPDILEIAKCMKAKGYMRVEDTAGVCDLLAIVQCFERQ